jgi:hypothetical protein
LFRQRCWLCLFIITSISVLKEGVGRGRWQNTSVGKFIGSQINYSADTLVLNATGEGVRVWGSPREDNHCQLRNH